NVVGKGAGRETTLLRTSDNHPVYFIDGAGKFPPPSGQLMHVRTGAVMTLVKRLVLIWCAIVGFASAAIAADAPKEIRIDWATYNPVSMLLKDKGFLEKEFARDGTTIRWVQTNSSSNALQFLNAGSIDFGSTAGS